MAWVYKDRNVPRYPHLEYLDHIRPDPHLVLGRRIDWTLKEDGSNCGIYLNENDELTVRSRNMDVCDSTMLEAFKRTGFYEAAEESLFSAKQWGLDYVIFGELMTKGKSPILKAKTDTPPINCFPDEEEGKIILPPLADSDLYGAIEKVREIWGTKRSWTSAW